MFSENLKNLRNQKGLSQEELAERLHVVRQTVSKWEKGLSVPDAELIIRIAEIFETSVSTLLGDTIEPSNDKNVVAEKLEQLNVLLAERNRRSRRIWKAAAITLISIAAVMILLFILNFSVTQRHSKDTSSVITEQSSQLTEPIKNKLSAPEK